MSSEWINKGEHSENIQCFGSFLTFPKPDFVLNKSPIGGGDTATLMNISNSIVEALNLNIYNALSLSLCLHFLFPLPEQHILTMGQWTDYKIRKLLCQRPVGWFALHTYSLHTCLLCFDSPLLCSLSLSSPSAGLLHLLCLFFHKCHTGTLFTFLFLLCKAFVLQLKESVGKGWVWLGVPVRARVWSYSTGAVMARCQ